MDCRHDVVVTKVHPERGARMAPDAFDSSRRPPSGEGLFSGHSCCREGQKRRGAHQRARFHLLLRPRSRRRPAVRLLCGDVYPAVFTLQSDDDGHGGGVPCHRRERLRAEYSIVRGSVVSAVGAQHFMRRTARILPLLVPIVFGATTGSAQQTDAAPGRVLVMPLETVRHDGRIIWMGEASSVLLADDLNAFGVSAITREER